MSANKNRVVQVLTVGLLAAAIARADTAGSPNLQITSLENLFVGIADHAIPAVVSISATKAMPRLAGRGGAFGLSHSGRSPLPDDVWRDFFGQSFDDSESEDDSGEPAPQQPVALGTGFVIEAYEHGGGLLLTNNHVVAGADGVQIKFTEADDERPMKATVVGTDPDLDVALLEVKTPKKLTAVPLGDSDRLKVGEWIAAVGNPFGHGHSVTHGIVSAKARTLPGGFGQYLQVDAPINPGNSGGPLLDLQGQVVGINNAIDARGPGIGFAIPINAVRSILPQLKSSGRVDRGFIGLAVGPSPDGGPPIVLQVVPGQPAARARLRKGDAIARIGDHVLHSPADLVAAISDSPVGGSVTAEVLRDGRSMKVDLKIARRPTPLGRT